MTETDEELFAKARAHMEKWTNAASLDRRLWDATVRLVFKAQQPEGDTWNLALEDAARDLDSDRVAEFWCDPCDPISVLRRSAARIRAMKRTTPQPDHG